MPGTSSSLCWVPQFCLLWPLEKKSDLACLLLLTGRVWTKTPGVPEGDGTCMCDCMADDNSEAAACGLNVDHGRCISRELGSSGRARHTIEREGEWAGVPCHSCSFSPGAEAVVCKQTLGGMPSALWLAVCNCVQALQHGCRKALSRARLLRQRLRAIHFVGSRSWQCLLVD